MIHRSLEQALRVLASPGMVYQYSHLVVHFETFYPYSMFKLQATALVMVSTRNFGSSSCANFWFCTSRLLILAACWLILCCLCQEFFDSLGSCDTSDITEAVVSITAVQELSFPNLLQLLKVRANRPQNWVQGLRGVRGLQTL